MESFEVNKLLGALLGTVFIVFSIALISDGIFSSPEPAKPGFEIVASEAPAGGETGGGEAAQPEPIAPLLAKADPAAGEAVFKKCAACHTGDKGGANKVGPNLWGVVNRPIAEHEGFSYSAALSEKKGQGWDYEHLNSFLISPKTYAPGTKMSFAGISKDGERADVIAYLRSLSDSPAPLPGS